MKKALFALLLAAGFSTGAQAAVYITEWEYNGSEFIEFTNLGSTSVDFTGWSFDDDSRTVGTVSLSSYGTVAAGESVILTDVDATSFRAQWNLSVSVKVIGNNAANLGRADEINLYDNLGNLVDRLTFNDQGSGTVKGPRTDTASAWAAQSLLGANNASLWTKSTNGDAQGSVTSVDGYFGNPGYYPVPEPGAILLFSVGLGFVFLRLRRRPVQA